jgi:hypothetical protein
VHARTEFSKIDAPADWSVAVVWYRPPKAAISDRRSVDPWVSRLSTSRLLPFSACGPNRSCQFKAPNLNVSSTMAAVLRRHWMNNGSRPIGDVRRARLSARKQSVAVNRMQTCERYVNLPPLLLPLMWRAIAATESLLARFC